MKRLGLSVLLFLMLGIPAVAQTSGEQDNYSIILSNIDTGVRWWEARYDRTLSPTHGWTDGDRCGYRGGYGFLYHLGRRGRIVLDGRFTFTRIDAASAYAKVNDSGMAEGIRYYDGTLDVNNAGGMELGDCPASVANYAPFAGNQLPTIKFMQNGQVLETRNYKTLDVADGITFQQVSKTSTRIGVVAYENGLPVIEIYYDSLVRGVTLTSDIG